MFPDLIIDYLAEQLLTLPGVTGVVKRGPNELDANGTLSILATLWEPDDYETGGLDGQPSLVTYQFIIGHYVKDEDRERGAKTHREVAKNLLRKLYDDEPFKVGLRALHDDAGRYRERIMKFHVTAQRYNSNEIDGKFVSMSATELSVQVQTV